MKLTSKTITVLKNFATINAGIQFVEGNQIRVAAKAKNMIGIANVDNEFPDDFAIYDLNQFLSVHSMFDDPDVEFHDDYMIVSEDASQVRYFYTDPDNIVAAPYDLKFETTDDGLFMSSEDLKRIQRASATMKLSTFSIEKTGDNTRMVVCDSDQREGNRFTIDVEYDIDMVDFHVDLDISNLNLLPLDYEINFSEDKNFLEFRNAEKDVTYYVAVN